MKTRIVLNGNQHNWRIGIGELARWECYSDCDWNALDQFLELHSERTCFIILSYELRHCITLSEKLDHQHFPLVRLWVPESTFHADDSGLLLTEGLESEENRQLALQCLEKQESPEGWEWKPIQDKNDYLQQVRCLQQHIQRGDIYEVNYCQQLVVEQVELATLLPVYDAMNSVSRAPFSFLYEAADWKIASASPERFLKRKAAVLTSEPIKGTAPRHVENERDEASKSILKDSHKDRTENVMIVDLVRNDLSRLAKPGTVQVEELCEVYSFPTVHQLISTISCELRDSITFSEIIRATFPMGSMTGAPKVSAMHLAEKTERFTRGIYSGSVGYIAPGGDFDLNVVIRSIVYDVAQKKLSCGVGGAITILSDPEAEYEECRTKVDKLLSTVGSCQW